MSGKGITIPCAVIGSSTVLNMSLFTLTQSVFLPKEWSDGHHDLLDISWMRHVVPIHRIGRSDPSVRLPFDNSVLCTMLQL